MKPYNFLENFCGSLSFVYLSKEQLEPFIGQNLTYESVGGVRTGRLVESGKGLWLPSCGGVSAMTCKILVCMPK